MELRFLRRDLHIKWFGICIISSSPAISHQYYTFISSSSIAHSYLFPFVNIFFHGDIKHYRTSFLLMVISSLHLCMYLLLMVNTLMEEEVLSSIKKCYLEAWFGKLSWEISIGIYAFCYIWLLLLFRNTFLILSFFHCFSCLCR